MSEATAIKKQLKIKTGAIKRLLKDHNSYLDEKTQQKQKVDKLVAEGGEEWYIKNGNKMVEESQKMIDDSAKRLGTTVGQLRDLIEQIKHNPQFAEDEEFMNDPALVDAQGALEEVSI